MKAVKARTHGVEGSALLVVQWQLRLRQPVFVTLLGQVAAYFNLNQLLGQQQVEAVLAQHQFAQQCVGHAVGVLRQGRQGFALPWRAGDARVVQACPRGHLPESLLARLGRLALAQQHRQRPAKGVAEAVLIILRGPQAQLEQCRRQWRHRVEQGNGRLQLVGRYLAGFADFDEDADHLASTERYANTHARGQRLARHARRCPVVEQPPQGRGQGKA
ncbi:hypothetical protein D3C81_1566260 [compost metagenome]